MSDGRRRGIVRVNLEDQKTQGAVSPDAEADEGFVVPVGGGDEVVPTGRKGGGVTVEFVPAFSVAGDFYSAHRGFFRQVDLDGGDRDFLHLGVYGGEGGGEEGGGVVAVVMVHVGAVFPDDFNAAFVFGASFSFFFPFDDEVEAVGAGAVGQDGDGEDFSFCLVMVPAVELVHGVVGHEGQGAVFQGEDGAGLRLAQDGSARDAAALGEDVVCKDGEVAGGVGITLEVVAVW